VKLNKTKNEMNIEATMIKIQNIQIFFIKVLKFITLLFLTFYKPTVIKPIQFLRHKYKIPKSDNFK